MHFRISKKDLLDNLSIVSRAVSMNSPLPALHGIKLDIKEDSIKFTASDIDTTIIVDIYPSEDNSLSIEETGSVILEAKYIIDLIRKLDSDIIEFETIDGNLTKISGGSADFQLNGLKVENYPALELSKPEESFTINSSTLKEIISQTSFACSVKENKPVLTGVNLKCEGNQLICVATDTYRLARKIVNLEDDHEFNITVPAKSFNEIARIIPDDTEIEVFVSNKKIMINTDNIMIQTKLIDENYIDVKRIIPSQFNYELVVDARDILSTLDRTSLIKNDGISTATMEMSEDNITINSKSAELVLKENIRPVRYEGNNLKVSFRGSYVFDAIKALNAFQIRFQFIGENKPFVITAVDSDDVLQLVSQMRTYD